MGHSLVRGILNPARGISDKDNSPEAQAARWINGFADLDGLEFVARIDIGSDANGDDKSEVRGAITPDPASSSTCLHGRLWPASGRPWPIPDRRCG